jgi:hypothetical protein
MTRARFPVAFFACWLFASWVVPVCCLTTIDMTPIEPPGSATTMTGHDHRHHLAGAASDSSNLKLSASESCAQDCSPPAVAAVASRVSLNMEDHLVTPSIGAVPSSYFILRVPANLPSPICNLQLSPPGNPPGASVSLRV